VNGKASGQWLAADISLAAGAEGRYLEPPFLPML
jgi:hypothetical protein